VPPNLSNLSIPSFVGINHPGDIGVYASDDNLLGVGMLLFDGYNVTDNGLVIWYYIDNRGINGTYIIKDYRGVYASLEQDVNSSPVTVIFLLNSSADATDNIYVWSLFRRNHTSPLKSVLLEFNGSNGCLANVAEFMFLSNELLELEYINDLIQPGESIISPYSIYIRGDTKQGCNYTLYSIGDSRNPHLNWSELKNGNYIVTIWATDKAYNVNSISSNLIVDHEATTNIVYVDDDFNESTPGWGYDHFNSIQEAINSVPEGGTVYVWNGTYVENVVVDKSVSIIGNGSLCCRVAAANGNDDVFYVTADYVNISGFTVENASGDSCSGVSLFRVSNCRVSDIIGVLNNLSVSLWGSSYNVIEDNVFSDNWIGIYLKNSTENKIICNDISSSVQHGIELWNSSWNTVSYNNVSLTSEYAAISLSYSMDNLISHNNCSSNSRVGIGLFNSSRNNITSSQTFYNTIGIFLNYFSFEMLC